MSDDLQALEAALMAQRDEYVERHNNNIDKAKEQHGARNISAKKITLATPQDAPRQEKTKARHLPSFERTGYLIRLGVRKQRLSLDTLFEYTSNKLSELEARIEAEKAAKEAGFPIVGYVHSIEKLG